MVMTPEGENLRKAVKWISEEKQYSPGTHKDSDIINEAAMKFNLSPAETDFLYRFLKEQKQEKSGE